MATRFRWVVAGLLFAAGVINYLDRAALSITAPLIAHDLHLGPAALGIVFGSFSFGYAAFCFVGGFSADRWGPKRTFAAAMMVWSLFCAMTGLVTSFWQLLVVRVAFGIGEGPMGTTNNKSVHGWFPRSEVGLVMGIVNAGQPLGGALAGPIIGLLALQVGWRVAFLATGVFGIAWVCAWLVWMEDLPARSRHVSEAERAIIDADRAGIARHSVAADAVPLSRLLGSRNVIGITAAFFAYSYVLFFLLTWFPSYLSRSYGLDLRHMSFVSAIPWVCGGAGMVIGGAVSDLLIRRGINPIAARRGVAVACLAIAALGVFAASDTRSVWPAVALIAGANLFLLATPQCCWLLVQEVVPAGRVGAVGGFVHLVANLAGILGPVVTGFLVQQSGRFGASFVLAGIIAMAGMMSLIWLVRTDPALAEAAGSELACQEK